MQLTLSTENILYDIWYSNNFYITNKILIIICSPVNYEYYLSPFESEPVPKNIIYCELSIDYIVQTSNSRIKCSGLKLWQSFPLIRCNLIFYFICKLDFHFYLVRISQWFALFKDKAKLLEFVYFLDLPYIELGKSFVEVAI